VNESVAYDFDVNAFLQQPLIAANVAEA